MKRFINPSPDARSRRADHHDYRGRAYFAATNTRKRVPLFGVVERSRMYLNAFGKVVAEEWTRTGELRDEVSLDAFVVMPDHVHGLLWIRHTDVASKREGNREARSKGKESREARQSEERDTDPTHLDEEGPGEKGREMHLATASELPPGLEKRRARTLSTIMGCFKATVTRRINEKRGTSGETVWQSSFHDHIVRNRGELRRIRRYIRTNPQKWPQSDQETVER